MFINRVKRTVFGPNCVKEYGYQVGLRYDAEDDVWRPVIEWVDKREHKRRQGGYK